VPKASVRVEGEQSYAFVVGAGGRVERRAVTTGGADGDRLEILGGLTAGERVVISPPLELRDGAMVVVR
jgi:multidrug efflux pump subunit AcrA (membrane-fusion protein)